MLLTFDKRKDDRHKACPSLTYRLSLAGKNYPAKALNQSDTGISFESGFILKPGTIVCVKRENCPYNRSTSGKACDSCRTITFATIKWCKKGEGTGVNSYLAGAKYIEPGSGY